MKHHPFVRAASTAALCWLAGGTLGGCSTVAGPAAMPSQGDVSASTSTSQGWELDAQKMGRIEQSARRYGIGLVWVNPPTKRVVARAD